MNVKIQVTSNLWVFSKFERFSGADGSHRLGSSRLKDGLASLENSAMYLLYIILYILANLSFYRT